ncbi:MAG TPA: HAEPLYID family protein [Lacibacter sp.]|nr:HAEPLYID family protein [Lacibacter sp.]HMO88297.1 HAEPLYID family protein [Lacibacter sp.]HMP87602.1 HAEPLYID family protein [Lacibacter sp.]
MKKLLLLFLIVFVQQLQAQVDSLAEQRKLIDSLYIDEVQSDKKGRDKVLHAEPLFIDLIRDLGARKGEKEWNFGFGLNDNNKYDLYTALVEYEFAPVNRLGFEVELPFSFYYPINGQARDSVPSSKLNSLKLATQYSFFVSEKIATSLAIGYLHEFELAEFRDYGNKQVFKGHLHNPFFIAAKRWGNNYHTLIYAGPQVFKPYGGGGVVTTWQVNTNFHYMIPGSRNFVGLEMNKEWHQGTFSMVLRPQMRVGITDNLLIGIVSGIPTSRTAERFSTFFRLIYEPGHRHVVHAPRRRH